MTDKEFYTKVARWKDCSPKTAREWWDAFTEELIHEIYIYGSCSLPNIGLFYLEHKDASIQNQTDSNGKHHTYIVPAREYPRFQPDDDFINDCNMSGVTKSYRRRLKKNILNARDQLREQRIAYFDGVKVSEEEKMETIKSNFADMLKEKVNDVANKQKKEYEGRKENEQETE